ncbi:glycosyltransferase family 9 protein [Ramlibacter sp.]|uniref:glycosyltransferase family 9 protein n=1 Tax=Ramlibacter sp. TaxID=1917967 RepID=UPI003D126AC0
MKSVLVVVTRQIGDVLLTTPLIREVRSLWPEAAVDVLGFEGTLGMLEGNPDVRERIATPAQLGFGGAWRLLRRLWRRYDLVLVADPGDRAHLFGWAASRVRAGVLPERSSSNWWKRALLTHAVESGGDPSGVHIVAERLSLLAPWTSASHVSNASLVAPEGSALPAPLQSRLHAGYIVMHTPSMWPYKQWPLSHFRELASLLTADGRQVVLTGGPGAHDRACVDAMKGCAPESMLVDAGSLDFRQLARLIRGAALYIGPDTSISHLAAACDVPVLAIFGPTNPQRWAPWPGSGVAIARQASSQTLRNITIVQADLPCVPCGKAGCEDHRQSGTACLPAITPQRVAEAARRILPQ